VFKFCWHKWGKWSRVIQDYEGSLHQMCECQKCGVIKRKRAASWMMGSLSADQVNDAIEAKLKQQNGYAEEKNT
jgi:hypothetical protein